MKTNRNSLALFVGQCLLYWIPRLKLGAAGHWPGRVAARIAPQLMPALLSQAKRVIVVTGTNGKTTTTRLLATLFQEEETLYNASGANLEGGILTTLIRGSALGKLRDSTLILETDERALLSLLEAFPPDFLLCLNLFRDQQDRFGELDIILDQWEKQMKELPAKCQLIFNGDDPALVALAKRLGSRVEFFGLKGQKDNPLSHAADSTYCPGCHVPLFYTTIHLSHLGTFHCEECGFSNGKARFDSQDWPSISPAPYNQYNTMAAVTVAASSGVKEIEQKIQAFVPAFGRGECLSMEEKEIQILLSKNPASMNASLSEVRKEPPWGVVFLLNDNQPDGRDVSWIWDAEYEGLSSRLYLSGKRAYDMALCLHHHGYSELEVDTDLSALLEKALQECPPKERLLILPNYTAMLEVRKLLTGQAIS